MLRLLQAPEHLWVCDSYVIECTCSYCRPGPLARFYALQVRNQNYLTRQDATLPRVLLQLNKLLPKTRVTRIIL